MGELKDSETAVTVVTQPLRDAHPVEQAIPCLVVFYGKNIGKRYFLDQPEEVMGRSDSASTTASGLSSTMSSCSASGTVGVWPMFQKKMRGPDCAGPRNSRRSA